MNRHRVLRVAGVAALVFAFIVVLLVVTWPEIVRRVVVWRLAVTTGRIVTLGAADLDLFTGRLALLDLRVVDQDTRPLATLERLEARFRPRDLLRGHLRITAATLQAPAVRVVRTGPREFNVSDLLGREPARGPGLDVTLDQLVLFGGTLDLEDHTLTPAQTWRVESLALQAQQVSSRAEATPGVVTVHAVAAGSPVSIWVTGVRLNPLTFEATVIARAVDASLAGLYLPPASPLGPARGTLDASAVISHEPSRGTRMTLDATFTDLELRGMVSGNARASRLTFAPAARVSAPSVRVRVEELQVDAGSMEVGRFQVDAGHVLLEDARLAPVRRWQAERVRLEVRNVSSARDGPAGTATAEALVAGSPVAVFVTNLRLAPLEFHATAIVRDVDVTLVRLYLPPDLPVQPERGVIDATVRIDHDPAHGVRLALDAAVRDVEVRRPAHFVTGPALRITAEDIAFDAGAVTVGRIEVGSDRLTIEDRTLTPVRRWPVEGFAVRASRLSSRRDEIQGVATLRASVAGASVSAWLTRLRIDPLELHATAIVRALDLALVRVYLPAPVPVEPTAGVVDATLALEHTTADGTRLRGDAVLTRLQARSRGAPGVLMTAPALRLTFVDGRWKPEGVSLERLEATGSGTVVDPTRPSGHFDIERLRLIAGDLGWPASGPARIEGSARLRDGTEVDVRGTAELSAPPPEIAWTADLNLELRAASLAAVAAYLPAAAGIGGRASATVAATVRSSGSLTARVRGDAEVAQLSLTDGRRTPLLARLLMLSGVDVEWPRRVHVTRLGLVEPRALIDRDRAGRFPLMARLASRAASLEEPSPSAAGSSPAAADRAPPEARPAAPRSTPEIAIGEVVVERGSLVFTDEHAREPLRVEIPRIDLTLRDVSWPGQTPVRLLLDAALPRRGTLHVDGTVTTEPAHVDLQVVIGDAALGLIQPYLGFPGRLVGRVDAKLAVTGPLSPDVQLTTQGTAALRRLRISDGTRSVLTVERLETAGLSARWPGGLNLDGLTVQRAWALIERDETGAFTLRRLLGRVPAASGGPPATTAGGGPAPMFEVRLREGVFEDQSATIVDGVTRPPARLEVAGARLTVQDFVWPSSIPTKLHLISPMPGGGQLTLDGTLEAEAMRLQARVRLDGVALAPARPYLPIEGVVSGRVSGDLGVRIALDPLSVDLDGQAQVQRFTLSHGDRAVMTAGRVDADGIKVDWPRQLALASIRLRRPRLLIERDEQGAILLQQLVTPRWGETAVSGTRLPIPAPGPAPPTPVILDIGTLEVERATARFVDRTTAPPYVEELSALEATVTGFTTAAGGRARLTSTGRLQGGASFKLAGEFTTGSPGRVDLAVDLRDFVLPRANPYLDRFVSWRATSGTLSGDAHYTLEGTRLEARHDVVVRQLEVIPSGGEDEVERRIGLPLGFLVPLMKNARGEIRLSVPVSGDLGTREFDFREAVWGAVRNLAIRLVALPFSRVGSLFFSEDSRMVAVALEPIVFEAGGSALAPETAALVDRVAAFLREKPAVRLGLVPIVTVADVEALERGRDEAPPPETLRDLAARRLGAVREAFARRGIDPERVSGRARRTTLVEASGAGRVELDLVP